MQRFEAIHRSVNRPPEPQAAVRVGKRAPPGGPDGSGEDRKTPLLDMRKVSCEGGWPRCESRFGWVGGWVGPVYIDWVRG